MDHVVIRYSFKRLKWPFKTSKKEIHTQTADEVRTAFEGTSVGATYVHARAAEVVCGADGSLHEG